MTTKTKPARKAKPLPTLDVRKPPVMIKLDAKGQPLPASARHHVAVHLPQYGLIFDARQPPQASSHADAVKIAKATKLLGKKGWTLPERQELQLLVDPKRHNPAIDTRYFTPAEGWQWHWTNTPLKSDPACAWGVYFGGGGVYGSLRGDSGFVRAVRRVPVVPASQ